MINGDPHLQNVHETMPQNYNKNQVTRCYSRELSAMV